MSHAQLDISVDAVEEAMSRDEPLYQCIAYKATRISEIVCKRTVTLFQDRVSTTHQYPSGEKCWYLDRSCKLEPEYVEEITVPEKRSVRPPGTWTVTAKLGSVTGSGQQIDLYCVTIHWPTSWLATRGYTSFTLGFETAQEAAQWHSHVQRQISLLRVRVSSAKGDASAGHSSKPSYDDRSLACSAGGAVGRKASQEKGFIASALEHWLGSKEDKPAAINEAGDPSESMQHRMSMSPVQIPHPPQPSSSHNMAPPGGMPQEFGGNGGNGLSSENSYSSSAGDGYFMAGSSDEQRWVPYRHTNGVAIYHHKESKCSIVGGATGVAAEEPGSEYMASNIVRGSPDECLAVLMDMTSNTTILGPASKLELLEDGSDRQVLCFTVEATGMARHLCAPREVIVERVFKREECGVDVILFSSCEPPPSSPRAKIRGKRTESTNSYTYSPATAGCSWKHASGTAAIATVIVAAVAAASSTAAGVSILLGVLMLVASGSYMAFAAGQGEASTSGSSKCSRWSCSPRSASSNAARSWCEWLISTAAGGSVMWYKPVRASVQGGYTISPREDSNGIDSPECLVTCILKVDLGGCLGEHSWLRPFAAALGWVDAYIERMLMAVVLVKDEVEQRRFLVQPFSMLTNTARTSAEQVFSDDEAVAGRSSTAGDGQQASAAGLRHGSSRWRNQQQGMPFGELSLKWIASDSADRQADMLYRTSYGQSQARQQQQESIRSSLRDLQVASAPELTRQASRKQAGVQQKQKGRLGRMASRIYALRPSMLRGVERSEAAAPGLQTEVGHAQQARDSTSISDHTAAHPGQICNSSDAQYSNPFGGVTEASGGSSSAIDLSSPEQLLASVGLPADTQVVEPSYYMGGPKGPAAQDSALDTRFWSELHTPGTPAPFKLRGATYLEDRTKVDGGTPQFVLGSVDLVETPGPTQHISRYLPAVRGNQAGYSFVVNLIIPGTPVLSLVAVFINEHHPDILDAAQSSSSRMNSGQYDLGRSSGVSTDSSLMIGSQQDGASCSNAASVLAFNGSSRGNSRHHSRGISVDDAAATALEGGSGSGESMYERPSDTGDWQPFDYALHRFLHGGDDTRTSMFKLIPHIAEGSWVIKQSVGTVPVILGNKLKTVYYQTDRYIEACVDVTSSSAAAYITGMVRGATKSLVIDLGFVLEGQQAEELPEALLGAFRLNHLDCTTAQKIDTSKELPLLPRPLQHHQLVALQQQAQYGLLSAAAGSAAMAVPNQGPAIAAEPGVAASLWHCSELPSSNGAAPAADTQPIEGNAEQQDAVRQLQILAQQLQQRCRNSLGVIETGRTMTGHARSRSAASVEELISSSNSPRAPGGTSSKLQPKTSLSSNITFPGILAAAQHQRQASSATAPAVVGGVAMPRQKGSSLVANNSMPADSRCDAGNAVTSSSHSQPVSTRVSGTAAGTAVGPSPVATVPSASAEAAQASSGSFLVNATPAKQLLNFLNFTGADKGSGGKLVTAPVDADATQSTGAGKSNSSYTATAAPETFGSVSSLLGATSGLVAHNSVPNAAAAGSGGLLNTTLSVGSATGHSNHGGVTTPTAAQQRLHHHRSSSNSEGRGPGWPASPPSATVEWSSKLSAAAYISRAHASALAASAQRRTHQQISDHQDAAAAPPAVPSPVASCHGGSAQQTGSVNGNAANAYLSGSPTSGAPHEVVGDGYGTWLSKQPRNSSSGSTTILAVQERDRDSMLQQQAMASAANGGGSYGEVTLTHGLSSGHVSGSASGPAGQKISAAEQLRLTQSAFRASSASGGQASHHHSSSSSSSMNMPALATAGKQESASATTAGNAADGLMLLQQHPPQQQVSQHHVKRPSRHRRFASMGAVQ